MTDSSRQSDRELIAGIRSGDTQALQRLLTTYWDALVQYAGRVLGGGDPQDVVQEAFIRLWAQRERWTDEGSVRSLLYTITRNTALDERRRHARGERVALAADPPGPPAEPSADVEAAQLRAAASKAVAALPPKRREVFRLAREEGLTYAEIAAVMGLSPQTVANHMSLALSDLRSALAPHLDASSAAAETPPPAS
ncbi:MAG: sigma-70 family RNA polymerase sigma factor [Gemmatimonadota bacterium]|jgi:RNA polymerase sigma-70 factor (ECF subfamily)